MDDFERRRAQFDREFERMGRRIRWLGYAAIILRVAVAAVVLWAIVRLVLHFT